MLLGNNSTNTSPSLVPSSPKSKRSKAKKGTALSKARGLRNLSLKSSHRQILSVDGMNRLHTPLASKREIKGDNA